MGRHFGKKQSSRTSPLKLSDLAPEPLIAIDIYWLPTSILFHYHSGRGMKYNKVCCVLSTVLVNVAIFI